MSGLKLAIFDVDGTLVDSQADILESMRAAFAVVDMAPPARAEVLGIVGLSLPQAMSRLAPDQDAQALEVMVEAYKTHYAALRLAGGPDSSPLYPGIRDLLDRLAGRDDLLLGVATGKSRRGLTALIESLGLKGYFVTTQVADDHPSKPHPAMIHAALREAGVDARDAVMIGDTTYDLDMAGAAGVRAIGVSWGYHPVQTLGSAAKTVDDAAALEQAILELLELTA